MSIFKKSWPFLVAVASIFYILPLLIFNTSMGIFILLYAMPALCFVCSIWYALKRPFTPLWAIAVAVMFIPSAFLYFNSSALVYSPVFGVLAFLGNLTGKLMLKLGRSRSASSKPTNADKKKAAKAEKNAKSVRRLDTSNTSRKKLARIKKQK